MISTYHASGDEFLFISSQLRSSQASRSNATMIYIRLLCSVIDAYIDKSTSVLNRVFHAWTSVFSPRIRLLWIDTMGKEKLDNLFVKLSKYSDQYNDLPKRSAHQYCLTQQAIYSIELNAHCLIYLTL